MRRVGEIRAGQPPMPAPNEPMHPVLKMFLAVTGELTVRYVAPRWTYFARAKRFRDLEATGLG